MNNLKTIRELYGITQDEIATAINVNNYLLLPVSIFKTPL